ncbi:MAG: DNA replication/repair protein RecF [Magnetococcales bacterium]|nr:DNA replication/repair protein RecF [Magnetococcales bacterium]
MVLNRLSLVHFRNLAQTTLNFHPGINLVVGGNGQGKSNLLEAIGLLATGRSFRRSPPEAMRQHGSGGFHLQGEVHAHGLTHRLAFQGTGNRQMAELNGKSMAMASTMDRVLAAVLSTPDSPDLIHDGPGERRNFLDWVVFSRQKRHAATVRDYQNALKARNRLLKGTILDPGEMDAWEDRLAVLGAHILASRLETLERLRKPFPHFLEELGMDGAGFQIVYFNPLVLDGIRRDVEHLAQQYRMALGRSRKADHLTRTTSVGPHRDDLRFIHHDRPLGRFGSRGQKKRFLLALKLAELHLLEETVQARPLLLLDDPASELDADGMSRMLRLVSCPGQQAFITAVKKADLSSPHLPHQTFHVQAGQFKPEYPQS